MSIFADKQQEVDINSLRLSESEEDTKVNIFYIISSISIISMSIIIISFSISIISNIISISMSKFISNRVVVGQEKVKEHPCLKSVESSDLLATPTGENTNNTKSKYELDHSKNRTNLPTYCPG